MNVYVSKDFALSRKMQATGCFNLCSLAFEIKHVEHQLSFQVFTCRYVNDDYDIDLTQCRSYPQQIGPSGFNEMGPACYVQNPQTGEVYEETCAIYYCGRKLYNSCQPPTWVNQKGSYD